MGFALWIESDVAWAQGLHEYRPMGVAVVAVTDRFRHGDFDARRPAPSRARNDYAGLFASLEAVNLHLARMRRSPATKKKRSKAVSPTPAWI